MGTASITRIAVAGITGRVGQNVARLAHEDPVLELTGGILRPGSDAARAAEQVRSFAPGWDGVLSHDPARVLPSADVVVDFTRPDATIAIASACREHGVALVSGTTGLDSGQMERLRQIAEEVPVFYAANMSPGINAILDALPRLAQALRDYDIEIVETHHRHKVDAPSGTAYTLARALGDGVDERLVYGRQGPGARSDGEIGIHAVRAGGNPGEHSIILASDEEQVTISHRSFSRLTYARGALRAARFIAGRPAGMYTTADVFG